MAKKKKEIETEHQKKNRIMHKLSPTITVVEDLSDRKMITIDDQQMTYDEVQNIATKICKGDYTYLIENLTANIIVMQQQLRKINYNLIQDGFFDQKTELMRIQSRVYNEMRKTTLSIQELVEPKKTIFVKGDAIAQQNNQVNNNFSKNSKNENELSKEVEDVKVLEQGTTRKTSSEYTQMETMGKINRSKN